MMPTAHAPLSIYTVQRPVKKAGKKARKDAARAAKEAVTGPRTMNDLLEPSVDGPPSPESIRALNKQMKRSSFLDKHSSGNVSLQSRDSERQSWEQTLENFTLSRRSSGRSETSSMPSRDRPESLQIFGKTLFNRRGRIKRESSIQSSSSSSQYSSDLVGDSGPSASQGSFMQTVFARRRAGRVDGVDDDAAPRRLQISGPYNFQHLAHSNREVVPQIPGTRMEPLDEFPTTQTPPGFVNDMSYGDMPGMNEPHIFNFNRRGMLVESDIPAPLNLGRAQQTRSQEQLKAIPPPRPPRSPVDTSFDSAPTPPLRGSSRLSTQPSVDTFEPLERPVTSNGVRRVRPFAAGARDSMILPPVPDMFAPRTPNAPTFGEIPLLNETTPPEMVEAPSPWPFSPSTAPLYETTLSEVPEEEEAYTTRRSRASVLSNNSSLRGSQSVPLLRQLAQAHSRPASRPFSGASDTLGHLDLAAQPIQEIVEEKAAAPAVNRESWEDDIDYCYDHAAEADCEYAWDRASIDLAREEVEEPTYQDLKIGNSMTAPSRNYFDVPALSPSSQVSNTSRGELLTPTVVAPGFTIRKELKPAAMDRFGRPMHVRTPSQASSFKESHGFNLSPTLLIPADFRQQTVIAGEYDSHEDFLSEVHAMGVFDGSALKLDETRFPVSRFPHDRDSVSTTGSYSPRNSEVSERHVSTSTGITRLTTSTLDGWNAAVDAAVEDSHHISAPPKLPPPPPPPAPALFSSSASTHERRASSDGTTNRLRKNPYSRSKSTTGMNDQAAAALSAEVQAKRKSSQKQKRPRANTTSETTRPAINLAAPPLVTQLAMYPAINIGMRI